MKLKVEQWKIETRGRYDDGKENLVVWEVLSLNEATRRCSTRKGRGLENTAERRREETRAESDHSLSVRVNETTDSSRQHRSTSHIYSSLLLVYLPSL